MDHFLPEVTQPWTPQVSRPAYHVDGQIDDEVYVYGSFIQSKMFHQQVRCSDCHDMHTTRILAEGNLLCVRCHTPKPENPTVYDAPSHHFHERGSKGAQCVECHMPQKTYMGIDARRDHSIRVPRPDLSVKFGTPNACNKCHDDQTAAWAADWIVKWKGPQRPREVRHPEANHAFRAGQPDAEKLLLATVRDKEAPAFTRAGALLSLRNFLNPAVFKEARSQLKDPDPIVRTAAVSQLDGLPPESAKKDLVPMLNDKVKAVRTEAARVLARVPREAFSASEKIAFDVALQELKQRSYSHLDRPESYLSLAILDQVQGDLESAIKHFRLSIERDTTFVLSRMNLAMLLNGEGRNAEAEELLREVIELQPEWGQPYFDLGRLIGENPSRIKEALEAFRKTTQLEENFARAHYNLGVCLWKMEKRDEAAVAFRKAASIEPKNPEYPRSTAEMFAQVKRWTDALPYAETAAKLSFGDVEVQEYLLFVRRMARQQRPK